MDKAFRLANAVGVEPHSAPTIDNFVAAEDLFPAALREAVIEQGFRRTFSLTVASGAVALPDGIILDQMKTATIESNGTPTSFEERYSEYVQAPYRQINYSTVKDKQFLFRAAGGSAGAYNGNITLSVVAMPDIPAALTTTIVLPQTVADRTSEILARMLRNA